MHSHFRFCCASFKWLGGLGGLLPQGSHRPVRAQFTHTVPQVRLFAAQRYTTPPRTRWSYPLLSRGHEFGVQCLRHVSLQRFPDSTPASLHRVPSGGVSLLPRYYQALRLPIAPPAALRFPSLGGTIHARTVCSPRWSVPHRGARGFCSPRRYPPGDLSRMETIGPPTFLGNPLCRCPALRPRQDRPHQAIRCDDAAPARTKTKAPTKPISGLNHTAWALAVYASQDGSLHHHARLASGYWPGSTGRDWLPAGFQ